MRDITVKTSLRPATKAVLKTVVEATVLSACIVLVIYLLIGYPGMLTPN